MDMEETLKSLGCRLEGDFTLHSGAKSSVKWDIAKLFDTSIPNYKRLFYLRPWHREVLKFIRGRDILIVGIPSSGHSLGLVFASFYGLRYAHPQYDLSPNRKAYALVMDDVLTTGSTVRELFDKVHVLGIAVLVNRSRMTKLNKIPIISGFYTDLV